MPNGSAELQHVGRVRGDSECHRSTCADLENVLFIAGDPTAARMLHGGR